MLSGSTQSLCGISSLSALPPAVNTAIWCRIPYVAISRHLRHVRTAEVGATWVSAGFTLRWAASSGVRITSPGLTPELLHNSLVLDGAAPDGQLQSFWVFSETTMPVSPRHNRKAATVDNVSAVVWPHKRPRDREAQAKQEKQASDQFLAAQRTRFRRLRTKFERKHYDWLTASKVAQDFERLRWLHKLASLVWASSRRSNLDMSMFSVRTT